MDAEWLKILASGGTATILGGILVVLWRHYLEILKESREANKETLLVLGSLTKAIETMPTANREAMREQAERVLEKIEEAVDTITKHTEDHVKPGRKPAA